MTDYLVNQPFCSDDFIRSTLDLMKSSEVRIAGDQPAEFVSYIYTTVMNDVPTHLENILTTYKDIEL